MKHGLCCYLLALLCGLTAAFSWGEEKDEVVRNVTKNISYGKSVYGTSAACLRAAIDAADDDDIIATRGELTGDGAAVVVTNKSLHFNVGISSAGSTTSSLWIHVSTNGHLTIDNDNSFYGYITVDGGGKLDLNGGVFYSDGTHPIIETAGDVANAVVVRGGAKLMGIYTGETRGERRQSDTAVTLNGEGTFTLSENSSIQPYYYSYSYSLYSSNVFNVGICVQRGSVICNNASIDVRDTGILIGDRGDFVGDSECNVINTRILSSGGGIYAVSSPTNEIDISVVDSSISSLYSGIKLASRGDLTETNRTSSLTIDGKTTINTRSSTAVYAIEDDCDGKLWDVQILRGVLYRMKRYLFDETEIGTNNWIVAGSEFSWNPATGEDNLTLTVTREEKTNVQIEFECDIGVDEYGACVGHVITNFWIPYGGAQNLSTITPESLGITNANGVFAGWYGSITDAQHQDNRITQVTKSIKLWAGWNICKITFRDEFDETDIRTCTTGLAQRVVNSKVDIPFKPSSFGWEGHEGYTFAGWCGDSDCQSALVTELSVPISTNLYAKWVASGTIAWIEGTTNEYTSLDAAFRDADGTNLVVLTGDVLEENPVAVDHTVRLSLNGFSLGDPNTAAGCVFDVTSSNGVLVIEADGGTLHGRISIADGGAVELVGGTYVCKEGAIVTTSGSGCRFLANDAIFRGALDDIALLFEGDGYSVLSNSTIGCWSEAAAGISVGISAADGRVDISGDKMSIKSGWAGLLLTNAICHIERGASITAPYGVYAADSEISVADSTITSTQATADVSEPCAFFLEGGTKGRLALSGKNVVEGGVYDQSRAHPLVRGALISYNEYWESNIEITGGTYSRQASNDVVMTKWIPTNCVCVWETATRFTVNNPGAEYKITYDATSGLPKDADPSRVEVRDPEVYFASTNFSFRGASYSPTNEYGCSFEGWYFQDRSVNSNQVVAISNGCVVVSENGKTVLTDITGDLQLVAKWGPWEMTACSVLFASGVVIKEVDPEDPEWVVYHEVILGDEDDMATNGVSLAAEFPVDGLEFYASDKAITLPTGIEWKGHTLKGWTTYDPDSLDDPENPPEWTNIVFAAGAAIDLSTFVDRDGNLLDGATLHAVWAVGGEDEDFVPSFDHLYDNYREKVLTGGDTYMGYVTDGENGPVVGSVTAKLGSPRSDGTFGVSATIKITGEGASYNCACGTYRFSGNAEYSDDQWQVMTEDMSVTVNDETHSLVLIFDSKTISGQFDGNYYIHGGVNLFKGTEAEKEKADEKISPLTGRWNFIFTTTDDETYTKYAKKIEDGIPVEEDTEIDGQAFAWGYSYVSLEILDRGRVKVRGKLANGKDVSSSAKAIVGDNMICIPVTCSVYSGRRGGGFGFTAFIRAHEVSSEGSHSSTNEDGVAYNDSLNVYDAGVDPESVSYWDSSMSKSMPFTATIAYTNYQRVVDIEMSGNPMLLCVDLEKSGWCGTYNRAEKMGDLSYGMGWSGEDWVPADPLAGYGYKQYVDVLTADIDGALKPQKFKTEGKNVHMKLADGMIIPGKNGTNYSSLNLKYDRAKGTFKGSFKVYSIRQDEEGEDHLKKTKVCVYGALAQESSPTNTVMRGYGFGRIEKVGSQPVTLEDPTIGGREDPAIDNTMIDISGGTSDDTGPSSDDEDSEEDDSGDMTE